MQLDRLNKIEKLQRELYELEMKRAEVQERINESQSSAEFGPAAKSTGPAIFATMDREAKSLTEQLDKLKKELLEIGDLDPGKGGAIDFAAALQLEIIKTNDLFKKQGLVTRIADTTDESYAQVVKLLAVAKEKVARATKGEEVAQLEKLERAFRAVIEAREHRKQWKLPGSPTLLPLSINIPTEEIDFTTIKLLDQSIALQLEYIDRIITLQLEYIETLQEDLVYERSKK